MLLFNLWSYLRGYAIIELEGFSLEKIVSQLSSGIRLSHVIRSGRKLTARIDYRDLSKLNALLRGQYVLRVRIFGIPLLYRRLKPRFMIFAGIAVALAIYLGISCFVWSVDVQGVDHPVQSKILRTVTQMGIKPGALRWNVDTEKAENTLAMKVPELAWVSIKREGSRIYIKAAKRQEAPQIIDRTTPADVYAAKDAIIERILVLQGRQQVEEGQSVKKGQLLIAGTLTYEKDVKYTHAMGEVMGLVQYSATARVPLKQSKYVLTGKQSVSRYILIGKAQFPIQEGEVFQYSADTMNKKLLIGNGIPIYSLTIIHAEKKLVFETLSENQARLLGEERAYLALLIKLPADREEYSSMTECVRRGNDVYVTKKMDILENIAVERKISGS